MPISTRNGAPIYYEVHGKGFPVLMITGMANVLDWFHYNIPALVGQGFQVIAQDLRGSNRTQIPATCGPYSTLDMARDSIGVLDDLSIDRAHVIGLSMGGMIAQHLALSHAERVERLVLVANGLARTPPEVRAAALGQFSDTPVGQLHAPQPSEDAQLRASLPLTFTSNFAAEHPERYEFFRKVIFGRHRPRPETKREQVLAACEHDTLDDLCKIRSRTLLLVGELDQINGGLADQMAARIPDCDLRILEGMSHGLNFEHADEFNRIVLTFLSRP